MNGSNIEIVMDLLVTLSVILLVVLVFCWIWILTPSSWTRAKTRKMKMYRNVRESRPDVYIPGLRDLAASRFLATSRLDEIRCYRCGALSPTHYHGCPYAAQWCIETVAKPRG